jgi:hypothetical protein
MSQFVQMLQEVIEQQESATGKLYTTEMIINRIEFQKMQSQTKLLLQSYEANHHSL